MFGVVAINWRSSLLFLDGVCRRPVSFFIIRTGKDIPLNMDKIAANKSFANKLWNCCKFVTENALKGADEAELASLGVTGPLSKEEFDTLALPERYIISKCHELVESVTNDIENYQLGAAGSKVRLF